MKLYRDQLKDLLSLEFGAMVKFYPTASGVRGYKGAGNNVSSAAFIQYLELVPLVIEEYERELARLRDRYYNSQIDEE
jgi:hypothetical protein